MHSRTKAFVSLLTLCANVILLAACGSSSSAGFSNGPQFGIVSVSVSDPPSCSAPQGPFTHVYVTIKEVRIHQSDTADANASGWTNLTPDLANNPRQVDLFGLANNACFLAMLGNGTQLQAGQYQQIRIILADNNTNIANNACGNAGANCVVLAADPANPRRLNLSSEATTGIKIPSGQIAGGRFTIGANETKDLNIDFNACASIVVQPNGQYRLKPVLRGGEASLQNSTAISGTVVDAATTQPITTGTTVIALEQRDTNGVDRVIMETKADAQGHFSFCIPSPNGTYDVVAVTVDGTGKAYAATITTGVSAGTQLGNIPMKPDTAANPQVATINGTITSVNATNTAQPVDASISALHPALINGANVMVTVPLVPQTGTTVSVATTAGGSCPANTACATYALGVPSQLPNIGAFVSGGTTTYTQAPGGATYTVEGRGFVVGSGGTANCTPPIVTTTQDNNAQPLAVIAAGSVTAATLNLASCQ
jgi:hypothetical protein